MRHLARHSPLTLVTLWSRRSAEVARRNAMAATTACADRRRERVEVSEYISSVLAARAV